MGVIAIFEELCSPIWVACRAGIPIGLYMPVGPSYCFSSSFSGERCAGAFCAMMFAYVLPGLGGTTCCLSVRVCLTHLGQFLQMYPVVRHCRHKGGDPGQESKTF